jgi:lipopolysaccharide biosynthesis glycosyltransferase
MLEGIELADQNRSAKHNKSVLLGVDHKFHPYALFLADQIATRSPDRDFDICIVSQETLEPHPLWERHQLRVCRLETEGLRDRVRSTQDISFASYLRLLAPSVFEPDYRRILYLDSDIFYQRGDISRLLDLDLGEYPLGAVRDMSQLRTPKHLHRDFEIMGLGYSKYFNSGFLLIDVKRFIEADVAAKALQLAICYADKLTTNDQSILNAAVHGDWAELSLVWNFQYTTQTLYFSGMFDVCFFHFVSRRKPFLSKSGIYPRRITEPYRNFFSMHFPQLVENVQDGLGISSNIWLHCRALLFHLTSFHKFLRNESRWRTDWDVIL